MYEIERNGKTIVLKAPTFFAGIGIIAALLACTGLWHLWEMFPEVKEYAAAELFGMCFLCLWTALAAAASVISFGLFGKRVTLDDKGVKCRFFFRETRFAWPEIRDYGLSYCGQTRGQGNTYHFYFSGAPLQAKNAYRKRLKGKIIKLYVVGDGYGEILRLVIPFCREKTGIEPYLAKDGFYFL